MRCKEWSLSINRDFFDELFVLEMANNHWGRLDRGLKIVTDFSRVVRYNNVRAAIKLQFRDVDSFVHPEAQQRSDIRYVKKTMDTRMSRENLAALVDHIRKSGCIPMATPFDEKSVDFCQELNLQIIKLASSDINDWVLIEKIAKTKSPSSRRRAVRHSRIWTTSSRFSKIEASCWRLTTAFRCIPQKTATSNLARSIF
jgi:N-acetylneuraminate synthase